MGQPSCVFDIYLYRDFRRFRLETAQIPRFNLAATYPTSHPGLAPLAVSAIRTAVRTVGLARGGGAERASFTVKSREHPADSTSENLEDA